MIRKFILSISVVLALVLFIPQVYAADFETSCNDTECTPDTYPNVFDPSFKWYPTASESRTIQITNTSTAPQFVGHRADDLTISGGANLSNALDLVVRRQSDNVVVWSGTLQTLAAGPEFGLSSLPVGQSETYIYTITMQNVGNEYQNTSAQFDLVFGYIVPTMTPTPTNAPIPQSSVFGAGTGGGSVQGASTQCTDQAPGSAPTLLSITPGTNSAVMNWSAAQAPVTYYLIAYGTSPGNYLYGANVGNTTSYTVQGLSGGQTYYFVVRAGNGCAPGPFSNEVTTSPAGVLIEGPAEGFTEDVLGDNTVEGELSNTAGATTQIDENGEVQAAEDKTCQNVPWWWMVIVGYGVIALILLVIGGKARRMIRILIQLISLMVSIVLLIYALCTWYFAVLLVVILAVVSYFLIEGYHGEK